ncbi:hypothetical protein ACFL1X_14305 [Candidatus Hydrogenedentota bacterium]
MSVETSVMDCETLLEYELRCSERYRRFLSVVMLKSGKETVDFRNLFGDLVRDSDVLFELEGKAMVLMSETDQTGAMNAVTRFKTMCNGALDVRYSVAVFPADGRSAGNLMDTGQRRLELAQAQTAGAVVVED